MPVMADEVVASLLNRHHHRDKAHQLEAAVQAKPENRPFRFVDCTVGGGGHSSLIAKQLLDSGADFRMLGLDQDREALNAASAKLSQFVPRVSLAHCSYVRVREAIAASGLRSQGANLCGTGSVAIASELGRAMSVIAVDGILADLGVSSHQLDAAHRGFSLRTDRDGPLDMRFDASIDTNDLAIQASAGSATSTAAGAIPILSLPNNGHQRRPSGPSLTAADLIAHLPERELARIFWDFGEEKHAAAVARAIVGRRQQAPFTTTGDLASVVAGAVSIAERWRGRGGGGGRQGGASDTSHPATKCFQALRIAVNGEMDAVTSLLQTAPALLAPGGRLSIITFHSLEDRLVKRAFAQLCAKKNGDDYSDASGARYRLVRPGGFVGPSDAEVAANPRARSAKLRTIERHR